MTERVHQHGALAGIELMATGTHVTGLETRLPARAVSGIGDDLFWVGASYEMDRQDIRRLQGTMWPLRSVRDAGFDIVNVMGAEVLTLPTAFLMDRYNDRNDEYGGSFENRARFWIETLEVGARGGGRALRDHGALLHRHARSQQRWQTCRVRGRAVHRVGGPSRRLLGFAGWRRRPWNLGEGRRPVALLQRELPGRLANEGEEPYQEADCRGRTFHQSRHDGRHYPQRPA